MKKYVSFWWVLLIFISVFSFGFFVEVNSIEAVNGFSVLAPNGGQVLNYNGSQVISWSDTLPATSTIKTYDIILDPYHTPCDGYVCPGYQYKAPSILAQGVTGNSFTWGVGNKLSGGIIYNGLYKVQVCQTNSGVCDSSDSHFQIVGGTDDPGVDNILLNYTSGGFSPGADSPPTPPPPPPPPAPTGSVCNYNPDSIVDDDQFATNPDTNLPGVSGQLGRVRTQTVYPGSSVTFTMSVSPKGYDGEIKMTATGLPYGAVPTFSPATFFANQSQTVTLTVCTERYTPYGTFPFQIHAGGINLGTGTLVVLRNTTTSASGGIAPVEQKKIKLLPDFLASSTSDVISENLTSGSAQHLTITPSGAGEKPLGIVVDAMFGLDFRDASGGTCDDADSACRYPAGPIQRAGNITGPRFFKLDDPLNPVLDSSKSWNLQTDPNSSDYRGDYGSYLHFTEGPFFSADGSYSVGANNTHDTFLAKGTNHALLDSANNNTGLVEFGPLTYLLRNTKLLNITDYTTQRITNLTGQKVVLPTQPSKTPTLDSKGYSVVLDDLVAQLGVSSTPTLRIYSPGQATALASKTVNAGSVSLSSLGSNVKMDGFISPSGKKYVFITASSGGNSTLFAYEISSSGTTITPITEGLSLGTGRIDQKVGITVGGQEALLVFNTIDSSNDPQNTQPRAYLISDLKSNSARDVFTGTPRIYPQNAVVSFATADASYVYLVGRVGGYGDWQGRRAYVWKFGSGGSSFTPPGDAPGSGSSGGSLGTANCAISPGTFGCFEISPSTAKNGEQFSIKLKRANLNEPSNTPLKLFISTSVNNGAYSDYKSFGDWLTLGDFVNGRNYQMNCSAYSSYTPGQMVNLNTLNPGGTILRQKLYATYFSGSPSEASSTVAEHVKDCRTQ
jgi:hypothetical protein